LIGYDLLSLIWLPQIGGLFSKFVFCTKMSCFRQTCL